MTTPSATSGGDSTSLPIRACHSGLPSGSNANTSPLTVPTTTIAESAPTPAASVELALIRQELCPVSALSRMRVPSSAAANTPMRVTAGASPGAARPTSVCQARRGVTVALYSGNGGIFLPPQSQPNDGGGIDGNHDDSD